jgi:hypothetical protein
MRLVSEIYEHQFLLRIYYGLCFVAHNHLNAVAGSSPTEDGGFLRVIKIHSTHFLRRGSKAVGPMS